MKNPLSAWLDRLLGRGEAATTVPIMDGALRPNRLLDAAQVVARLSGIEDIACSADQLWVCAGSDVYRLAGDGLQKAHNLPAPVTALAAAPDGRLAVALQGRQVRLLGGAHDGAQLDQVAGQPLRSVNALAFGAQTLWITEGSRQRDYTQWSHDLMELGHSGRVCAWHWAEGSSKEIAKDLAFAFGAAEGADGALLVSESWRHRVLALRDGQAQPWLHDMPAYPSRMARAAGGGFWLTCFAARTQLVEFVLREPTYRKRMMAEIDPTYWIAPALSSGHSYLEPLQGAGVKQMGIVKPWAPPRSYGLVIRVNAQGRIESSLHSRVDGHHHGITAVAEFDGALYVASKGSGQLLRLPLASIQGSAA